MPTNQQIMKTITTGSITSGLLSPEQAQKFIQQTFESTALGGLIRKETRKAKTGEIDKIGIDSRILRKKTENTDDGYRAKTKFSKVEYATTAVRLPWEITEESLNENIEGQNFEDITTKLMTTQLGVDLEDIYINGDEDTPSDDEDYDFLKINNGWLQQLKTGSHIEDRSAKNSGAISLDVFYDALEQMPNKFNDGTLKWLVAPSTKQKWEQYLLNQSINNGGGLSDSVMRAPAGIEFVPVPRMPADKILLSNPRNLGVVNTYDVKIRKTTEGEKAIMQDKRFYVVHLDFDPVIEEKDATVLVKGILQPAGDGGATE
ncbi:Phage major capsid protein, P2 family [Gracilibacillus orientalis]|uniref:Phage major capsid protein, P2 family n=1 Tax=Gracilibacillus orientalis TaxID=334253 RepID=A0A1I4PNF8_9BACI|nr:P2 family phage major capsid protein [Gracilibacillus orientalis]SFM29040.1 Phage major capsid protein, P2 family [Gracilibacillus orientalis]